MDMDADEMIGLGMEKRKRDGQVNSHGWEEETEDSVGDTKRELRCNGMKVMWCGNMTRRQGGGCEVIVRGVGTRHRWESEWRTGVKERKVEGSGRCD
jgi:hypothetical protein